MPSRAPRVPIEEEENGVVVELFNKDPVHGAVPHARIDPRKSLSPDNLEALAKYSLNNLNGSNFFLMWRAVRQLPCTKKLGEGMHGTVFRVCEGSSKDGCDACVAVKFGMNLSDKGYALESERHTSNDGKIGVRRREVEIDESTRDMGVTMDEVRNTRAVTVGAGDATPHIARYVRHVTTPNGVFLFTEYVPPVRPDRLPIRTLEDYVNSPLLSSEGDTQWRALVFQIIYTVAVLQAIFSGFRHNDPKLDNWGIRVWRESNATYGMRTSESMRTGESIRTWRLPHQTFMVKLLDFGLAHSDTPYVQSNEVATAFEDPNPFNDFVLFGSVPIACAIYDVHFIFSQMRRAFARTRHQRAISAAFEDFVYDCIPPEYFLAPLMSDHLRLTVEAQHTANEDPRVLPPHKMLQHAYFRDFVSDVASPRFSFSV